MSLFLYCDYPLSYGINIQDPATAWCYAIHDLHHRIAFYLIIVGVLVGWCLYSLTFYSRTSLVYFRNTHANWLELIWTVTPAFILWAIGLPSLHLLYLMDELIDPELTIKVVGNQWYWSYEYSDLSDSISYDSFLLDDSSYVLFRLLEVDSPLVLPVFSSVRLLITSSDVIHSFAVPSLGIKVDAIPGRLNSFGFIVNRPGTFYGQCSELCGFLHGFMPISVDVVPLQQFHTFLLANK